MVSKESIAFTGLLSAEQMERLGGAVSDLSPQQLAWVSGYLAGLSSQQLSPVAEAVNQAVSAKPQVSSTLTILVGSQSGNATSVANKLKTDAEAKGWSVKLVSMGDYSAKQLKKETHVAIVVSTHGEGDPPDDAEELHGFLGSKRAPKLESLKYSVLALGDSSYELFCQTGKEFDERLAKLGATRFAERIDCDVEFEANADKWRADVINKVANDFSASADVVQLPGVASVSQAAVSQYDRKHPFTATLLANQKITGRNSIKDIRHIEIDLEGSGLQYQPGDSLGIWFENDPALVDTLLNLLSLDGSTEVSVAEQSLPLRDVLIRKFELTQLSPAVVKAYAELADHEKLTETATQASELRSYIAERQLVDVIREYPAKLSAEQFISCLRKLNPRLYSIASSQAEVEEEVHLTVAVVRYDAFEQEHLGGASGFLAERLQESGEVKVFVDKNTHFSLPENGNTPIIMVGPGTGIAPFRAFLQEREATSAEGDNWLFFGNPTFTEDFLYQIEIQRYVKSGVLNKVDLAWSRDQAHKIYVQDKIREQGAELFQWLERGAHFYICGDASRMAKDVHESLIELVAEHGGKNREEAETYVAELRRAKRYQRDVY